jgi:hypothetical protein
MSGYQWQFVPVVYVMELKSGLFVLQSQRAAHLKEVSGIKTQSQSCC